MEKHKNNNQAGTNIQDMIVIMELQVKNEEFKLIYIL